MTRDARLSALHRGGFGPRGRASLTGICAGSVTASSSQPGRSAWRATSRASRGKRLQAAAAGRHASLRIQARSVVDTAGLFCAFSRSTPRATPHRVSFDSFQINKPPENTRLMSGRNQPAYSLCPDHVERKQAANLKEDFKMTDVQQVEPSRTKTRKRARKNKPDEIDFNTAVTEGKKIVATALKSHELKLGE